MHWPKHYIKSPSNSISNHLGIFSNLKDRVIPQARKPHPGSRMQTAMVFEATQAVPNSDYLGDQVCTVFASRAKGAACFMMRNARSSKEGIVQNLASFFCTEPEGK